VSDYAPIADYAVIGNCRTAALISRDGSMDWLCAPRFDSPAVFGALLDARKGGRFHIRAAGARSTSRRYVDHTNVLETTFVASTGRLRLVDLMPVSSEERKQQRMSGGDELLRAVECVDGEVDVDVSCEARPDYGRCSARFEDHGRLGWCAEANGQLFVMRADAPLRMSDDRTSLGGRFRLRAGERRYLSLSWHSGAAVLPILGDAAASQIEESLAWWRAWSARCTYDGPYRDEVVRSALVLKLMSYAPSGAIVAAPTTSLPEHIGGPRNWDYRYCWLRDASLTLRALFGVGYADEGRAFLSWLLHATRLTWPELQVLYDVYGESRVPERELPYLEGYAGSRPVRVGNGAVHQRQLDVYGEVIDAVHRFVRLGGRLDRRTGRMVVGLGRTVCRTWQDPDEGIWEVRSGRRHHTFSKAMCWVALDRLVGLHEDGHLRAPVAEFAAARDEIRSAIEARGYREDVGSYVTAFDEPDVDASLLLLGLYGYADPKSPRMLGTCRYVHARLGRDGQLYRYLGIDDGLPPGEGTFGIAGFWAVECRALGGDVAGAERAFETMCRTGNDVGLFSEEYDPDRGLALGNFPQAFTHIGLINAALTLTAAGHGRGRDEEIEAEQPVGKAAV
jgi:GH15 family glucan-1,4-alpha-glucosidase